MKKAVIELKVIPIEDDGFHILIESLINNKKATLILDTGASKTVLDQNNIDVFIADNSLQDEEKKTSGIGTNTMDSKSVVLDSISFNQLKINEYKVAVLDLVHVNNSYEKLKLPKIEGILGGDILNQYNAVIDYKNKTLSFSW